mgnify:CR=1 FL=1
MTSMDSKQINTRLNQLETLFSEQEYTVEALNTVVTQQAQDLDQLSTQIELLKLQIRDLKTQGPDITESVNEIPPHY